MQETLKPGDIVEGTHGRMKMVEDFLPRPEDLVLKEKAPAAKKVTLVLDTFTIEFFRSKAQEFGASYQNMMRKLLLDYAQKHSSDDQHLST